MPKNIIFINKSAKSKHLTRSEGFERSKIFSHVQQSPYALPDDARVEERSPAKSTSPDGSEDSDYYSRHSYSKRSNAKGPKSVRLAKCLKDQQKWVAASRRSSPISVLDMSRIDPFDCAAVPMDGYMTDMLKAYRENLLETVFQVRPWAEAVVHYHLKYASESAELLYAVLCSSSGTSYAKSMNTMHLQFAMQFKGQALSHLRQSIDRIEYGETPSIATIFAMGFHVYLECLNGDIEVARLHYSALEKCMATVRIENIPLPMRVGMMIPSFFVSGMLSRRPLLLPVFEMPDEESTRSFEDELLATDCPRPFLHTKAGRSFLDPANQALMGSRLCKAVQNLRYSQIDMIRRSTRQEIRTSFTMRKNIEYELLALPFTDHEMTPEQDVIRLALYLACKPTLISSPLTDTLTNSMASQIYSSLQKSSGSEQWSTCPELLLWALCVAASICLEGNQRAWIVREIAKVCQCLDLRSQGDMEEVLTGFFYVLEHFGDTLRSIRRMMEILPLSPDVVGR